MKLFAWYEVPFALEWDSWEQWREETRRRHPIQYFFRWTLPIFLSRTKRQYVTDPWYWLKCRLWHRYNVVVVKSIPCTGADQDDMILHAAFQCFCNFIELEQPWEFKATDAEIAEAYGEESERICDWNKIKSLYYWWQVRKDNWDDDPEDDSMLHKLIDLRGYFWT